MPIILTLEAENKNKVSKNKVSLGYISEFQTSLRCIWRP